MMRRIVPVACFVSVLPCAAAADPVTGFLVSAGMSAAAAGAVVSFGTQILVSLAISSIAARSNKGAGTAPIVRLANYAQPVSYVQYVVGRARVGGVLGFTGFATSTDVVTGQGGAKRHYTPILAAHPISGIVTHYLGERDVETDADGTVITAPLDGAYRIRPFTGSAGQSADPELVAAFSEVTAAFDFAGLSGAHIWARRVPDDRFSEVYPSGREASYAPVIDGHNDIYDPRSDSQGYTRNAALIIAWWITEILNQTVDWDEVADEADVCDQTVTNASGGSQPRWRIDGVLSDEQEFEAQREALQLACDAWMYERPDGSMGFRVGRYIAPTVSLGEADFLSAELVEGDAGRSWPTEIAAEYIEPDNGWRESPTGTISLNDSARQVREIVPLEMVADHNQACRVATRMGRAARAQFRLSATLGPSGVLIAGHRFVSITLHGVTRVFEVVSLSEAEDGRSFNLVARMSSPEDWEFVAATDEPVRPVFGEVSSTDTVPSITGLTVTAQNGPILVASWPEQDDALQQQIRYSPSGEGAWQTLNVPSGDLLLGIAAVVDGGTYDVQVRNRTSAGRASTWSSSLAVTAVANTTPPAGLTAFSVVDSGSDVDVSLTSPADENYFAVRILRADYPTSYTGPYSVSDAVVVRTEYGLPGNADDWSDVGLAAGHYAYWAEPINRSGVPGPMSGPEVVDIP